MPTQPYTRNSRILSIALTLLLFLTALPNTVLPATVLAAPGAEMDPGTRAQAKHAVSVAGAAITGQAQPAAQPPGKLTSSPAGGGKMTRYSAAGVTISAPDPWVVEEAAGEIFSLSLPGEFVFGFMDQEPSEAFPGVFAIVLFEQQSEMLAASMGEEVALEEVVRFQTDQGVPGLIIRFGGNMEGLDMGGSMYIVAAGDATYMLMILSTASTWQEIRADADTIAASITADTPSLMTAAEDDDMEYAAEDGSVSLIVPAGWQIQEIDDEDMAILLVDPEMTFVAAGMWEPVASLEDAADLTLYNALLSGTIGKESEADVLRLLTNSMDLGGNGSDFVVDENATTLLGDADAPVLRVGATMLDDGFEMPMMAYIRADKAGMMGLIALGNQDRILDNETTLLQVLDSIKFQ